MGNNRDDEPTEIKSLDDEGEQAEGLGPLDPTNEMKVEPSLPRPRPSVSR